MIKKVVASVFIFIGTFSGLAESVAVMLPSSWERIPEGHHLAPRSPLSRINEATSVLADYVIFPAYNMAEMSSLESVIAGLDQIAESIIMQAPSDSKEALTKAYFTDHFSATQTTTQREALFEEDLFYGNSFWVGDSNFLIHWNNDIEVSKIYSKLVKIKSLLISLQQQSKWNEKHGIENIRFHIQTLKYISSVNAIVVMTRILSLIPDNVLWSDIEKLKHTTSKSFALQEYKKIMQIKHKANQLILDSVETHSKSILGNSELDKVKFSKAVDDFFMAMGKSIENYQLLINASPTCFSQLTQ